MVNLYFVDRFTGKTRHILKEADEAWVNVNDFLLFLKKSKNFVWASERSGYTHKMYELMIYPMRKHGIRDKHARIHLFNTMLDFWRRNL